MDLETGLLAFIPPYLLFVCFMLWVGIKECKNQHIFGVLYLSLGLNIIGTIMGCLIIYKKANPNKLNLKKFNLFKKKKQKLETI